MVLSVIGFILFLILLRVSIACNPFGKVIYAVQAYRTRKAAIGRPDSLPMIDGTGFTRDSTIHGMPSQMPSAHQIHKHTLHLRSR